MVMVCGNVGVRGWYLSGDCWKVWCFLDLETESKMADCNDISNSNSWKQNDWWMWCWFGCFLRESLNGHVRLSLHETAERKSLDFASWNPGMLTLYRVSGYWNPWKTMSEIIRVPKISKKTNPSRFCTSNLSLSFRGPLYKTLPAWTHRCRRKLLRYKKYIFLLIKVRVRVRVW